MRYPLEFKEKVIVSRQEGLSYNEICQKFQISKSTVSLWCRNVKLSAKKVQRLIKKVESNWVYAAQARREKGVLHRQQIVSQAALEIKKLSKKDIFFIGLALYWGEGTKIDGDVAFSNSDPETIRLIMRFFRESCGVIEKKFRGRMFIHSQIKHKDNMSEQKALRFWSSLTKIPLSRFHRTNFYQNKSTSFKRGKIMMYGTLMVRVMDADLHRKIMGWIQGVVSKI
ncbi:MAG: hypothetical protein HW405_638 [Candidatus Berkelbacteria bacterium]|nr:hypothetical protein [Candidatus Berkelbacteria bacterium]